MRFSMMMLALALVGCAPAGYHYEVGSFTPVPDDPCRAATTPTTVNLINNAQGHPARRVVTIAASVSTQNAWGQAQLECHDVLVLDDGTAVSGRVFVTDPGGGAPLNVRWQSDPVAAAESAAQPVAPPLLSPPSQAAAERQSVPIEHDAVIYTDKNLTIEDASRTARELALMVVLNGYRCDSISSMRPWIMSYGFTLGCNQFRYAYEIRDRGGHWEVTAP